MLRHIKDKNVLFITTKNLDYIRNTQEISIIKENASSLKIIGSTNKHYLPRLLFVYFFLIKTSVLKFDTVFIGFAPQLVLPLFSNKFKKTYVMIDFFISLFDTFCQDRRKFRPHGPMGRLLHWLDRTTLKQAGLAVCDTVSHGKYFSEEFRISCDKLHTLYLQADTSVYHPVKQKKPAQLRDRYVVLYFGSILPLQGVDIVLKAVSLLQKESGIYFYMIGPVPDKDKKTGTHVKFIDWLSQKQLAALIGQADLCLAGHFNSRIEKASRTIPGKAFIYQAMEKPMILGDNPANHELFTPDSSHIYVEMGNARALADTILALSRRELPGSQQNC